MGTSTPRPPVRNGKPVLPANAGPDAPPEPPQPPPPDAPEDIAQGANALGDVDVAERPPAEAAAEAVAEPVVAQFTSARGSSTRFTKSRGDDAKARGRAARDFVRKASGGSRAAAQRMGAAKAAAGNLAALLSGASAAADGIREFVRTINLPELADRPIKEIYEALVDYVCPPDGEIEDSSARDAYLEAVQQMDEVGVDLDRPTEAVARQFMANFIALAVKNRIINSIANGLINFPSDEALARQIEASWFGFLQGCANDAMANNFQVLQADAFRAELDYLFESVMEYIEDRGERDAEA